MKINKLHLTIFSPCINVAVKNKSAEIGSQCLLNLDEQLAVYRIGSTCDVYSELAVDCLLILATIESSIHILPWLKLCLPAMRQQQCVILFTSHLYLQQWLNSEFTACTWNHSVLRK